MITINNKYALCSVVYLKTDEKRLPRIVINVSIWADKSLQYLLACGENSGHHQETELTDNINEII